MRVDNPLKRVAKLLRVLTLTIHPTPETQSPRPKPAGEEGVAWNLDPEP